MFNVQKCGLGSVGLWLFLFLVTGCVSDRWSSSSDSASGAGQQSLRVQQELQAIVERERFLWERIERRGRSDGEQAAFQSIADYYQAFVRKYPSLVEGWVLFGKYLRKTGQEEQAATCFIEANRLNPNLAVVKQQLGNHLFEEGQGEAALPYFLAAVRLEPEQALYHYQLGECLFHFRQELLQSGAYTRAQLDSSMQEAFAHASRLENGNTVFLTRYGESFFDVEQANWYDCLEVWKKLESRAPNVFYREAAQLYQARALGKLDRVREAKALLRRIESSQLQESKDLVLQELGS